MSNENLHNAIENYIFQLSQHYSYFISIFFVIQVTKTKMESSVLGPTWSMFEHQ